MIGILNSFFERRRSLLYFFLAFEGTFLWIFYATNHWDHWMVLLVGPVTLCMGLQSRLGSPKNWWAEWFGTIIDVNTDRFAEEYHGRGDVLRDEIRAWIKQCNLKPHYQMNAFRHVFLRKKHAMMFKLAWG